MRGAVQEVLRPVWHDHCPARLRVDCMNQLRALVAQHLVAAVAGVLWALIMLELANPFEWF